jgi:chorismate mutase
MVRTALCVGCLGIAVFGVGGCGGPSQSAKPSTVTVTASSQPTTTGRAAADWKYLKTQYAALLNRSCGTQADQAGLWAACAGLQNVDIDSFDRDAQTLPLSKDRADLLKEIADFKRDYGIWVNNGCGVTVNSDPMKAAQCDLVPLQISQEHDLMVDIVNQNAGQ